MLGDEALRDSGEGVLLVSPPLSLRRPGLLVLDLARCPTTGERGQHLPRLSTRLVNVHPRRLADRVVDQRAAGHAVENDERGLAPVGDPDP